MTTTTTTTFSTRLAFGTALAALCLGAAACGTETAAPAASLNQAAGAQQESRTSPRAAEHQAELDGAQCRREGHPEHGLITCTPAPTRTHSGGSAKYPDLHP